MVAYLRQVNFPFPLVSGAETIKKIALGFWLGWNFLIF
jgi:hypothetical protein